MAHMNANIGKLWGLYSLTCGNMLGLYGDHGKEAGNHYIMIGYLLGFESNLKLQVLKRQRYGGTRGVSATLRVQVPNTPFLAQCLY